LPLWIFLMIQNPDSQDSADSDLAPQGPSRAESELARFLGSPFSGEARFLGSPFSGEARFLGR
jgi:hypothetical protein